MQKFGGAWTSDKLSALTYYIQAYLKALKGKFELHYVDAFAGSGSYLPRRGLAAEVRPGSAQIALLHGGFDQYHFVEKSGANCRSLKEISLSHPDKKISISQGDANQKVVEICRSMKPRTRSVFFIDPFGMQIEWSTLEAVAQTGAADVWLLFPLSGVTRQLTKNASKLDADKVRALDRTLGTSEWRDAFYDAPPLDLFGHQAPNERIADSEAILRWTTLRLGEIFPCVVGPKILHLGRPGNSSGGPPLFALYFLAATRNPTGQRIARNIAKGVLKRLERESALPKSHLTIQ